MIDYPDIVNLTRDELVEEYCKLLDRYQDLRETSESDAQKLYELKRSLDTATAAQTYLSQELEQYANTDNKETEIQLHKTQSELQDVKKKCSNLKASLSNLQQDYNTLQEENSKINKNLEEWNKNKQQHPCEDDGKVIDEFLVRIQLLENENMDLLQKIEDFEQRAVRYTLTIAEYEKNIEILTDQINCLEENLQSKRADLEEKLQIIESTQEQLTEANAKIALLSSAADNKERKGNSLFAEVDDQRQVMKQLLSKQKKSYMEMKKIYNESEYEIRRLKRENISMRTELEACSEIFCNADKVYQKKLNERVGNLLNQNDELERKIKWTQEGIKEVAANKGVFFIDSILSYCKKETDEYKIQLHRVRLENACLEEQLRNSQQDMARWRFESLKSRCILIDRENLLTENKIHFKPAHAVEYKINEKDKNEAKPRIVSNRRSSLLETLKNRKSTSPSKAALTPETNCSQQIVVQDDVILNDLSIKKKLINEITDQDGAAQCKNEDQILEPEFLGPEMNKIIKTEIDSSNIKKSESFSISTIQDQHNEDKENSIICLDDTPILDNFASLRAKPPSPPSPMRPSQQHSLKTTTTNPVCSILTKNDLLINSTKHVNFSSDGDTVYNISIDTDTAVNNTSNAATASVDSKTTHLKETKNTEKVTRPKSNIVVRRIVVSSKH